jgi:hypothetical protein
MERKTRRWPVTAITFMNKARKDHIITLSYCYKVEEEVYGATASADSLAYWERSGILIVLTMVFPGTPDTIHGSPSAPGFPCDGAPIMPTGDRNA